MAAGKIERSVPLLSAPHVSSSESILRNTMLYGSMRLTPKLSRLPNLAAYFIAGQYPFVPAYAINNSYNVVPRGLPPRRPQRRRTCSASHRVTRALSLADQQLSEEMRELRHVDRQAGHVDRKSVVEGKSVSVRVNP